MAAADAESLTELRDARAETVLDPARIAALLQEILFPPLLVNVALPGIRALYTSALLKVDLRSARILLDGLNPDDGHQRIQPGSVMHVHGKVRGVQLDFATRVIEIQAGEQPPAYLARLPGSLRYHQRRQNFRVRTWPRMEEAQLILGPNADGLRGRLLDLSPDGIRLAFPRDPGFRPGERVDDCRLVLHARERVACRLEFIHFHTHAATGEVEAGARFVDPDARFRELLQRRLTEFQRRRLRERIPE